MRFEIKSFDNAIYNVSPRVWGKGAWIYLHTSALVYPRDDERSEEATLRREAYREELRDLPLVVPCAECRGHLRDELKKISIDDVNSYDHYNSVILWLHNQVRERQQKPAMSPEDVIAWLRKEGLDPDDCHACSIKSNESSSAQQASKRNARASTSGASDDSDSDSEEQTRTAALAVCALIVAAAVATAYYVARQRKQRK